MAKDTGLTITTPDDVREKFKTELKQDLIEKIGKAQATILLQKTPKKEIRKRLLNPTLPRGPRNPEFTYVEHAYVSETLNFATLLDWDLIVVHQERIGDEALVHGYLEIRFKGNTTVKKYGYGGAKRIEANRNQTWADVFKSATSDMLKNCAARLGLALDLYRHEEKITEVVQEVSPENPKPGAAPVLANENEPPKESQLQTIKNLGGDPEKFKTFGQAAREIKRLSLQKLSKKS